MASEKQEVNESRIGFALSPKLLDHKIANAIIVIDDEKDENVTLEQKNKKARLGSWWDNVEAYDKLSLVVKRLPKMKENNDVASKEDKRLKSKTKEDESVGGDESSIKNKGYGHVTLEDLRVTVEDLKSIQWETFDPIL